MDARSGAVTLEASFAESVAAATHLTAADGAAVEAARALARKIDAWDVIVDWAVEDAAESESRPKVPQNDNVSLASFLKFCDALGLTPAARNAVKPSAPVEVKDDLKDFKARRQG